MTRANVIYFVLALIVIGIFVTFFSSDGEVTNLDPNEVYTDTNDVFLMGDVLNIDNIDRERYDDVIAISNSLYVDEDITGDLIVLNRKVIINSIVEGDLYVASSDVLLGSDSEISGDVRILSAEVVINGDIGGDVAVISGSVNIDDSNIGGNLSLLRSGDIYIGENVSLDGSLIYTSNSNFVSIDENASISDVVVMEDEGNEGSAFLGILFTFIIASLSLFLFAILVHSFFPRFSDNVHKYSLSSFRNTIYSLIIGLIAWTAIITLIPLVFYLFGVSSLSILLFGMFMFSLLFIVFWFSIVLMPGFLGQLVLNITKYKRISHTNTLLLGSFLYVFVYMLGGIGFIIALLHIIYLMGGIIQTLWSSVRGE